MEIQESNTTENSMQTAIRSLFAYGDNIVRCEVIDNEPWFVAKDVANILGYSDTQAMTRRLDEEEIKTYTDNSSGQPRHINIISESGLYSSIIGSNKPEAKEFKRWLTKEVLPSIRKTGSYSQNKDMVSISTADAIRLSNAIKDLKNIHRFSNILQDNVRQKINPLIVEIKDIYQTIGNILPTIKIGNYEIENSYKIEQKEHERLRAENKVFWQKIEEDEKKSKTKGKQ